MSRPLPAADQALQSPPWWAAHWTGWPAAAGRKHGSWPGPGYRTGADWAVTIASTPIS